MTANPAGSGRAFACRAPVQSHAIYIYICGCAHSQFVLLRSGCMTNDWSLLTERVRPKRANFPVKCRLSRSLRLNFFIRASRSYRREGGASRPCGRATRAEGHRWFHNISQQVSACGKFHGRTSPRTHLHSSMPCLSSVCVEVSKLASVSPSSHQV